MPLTPDELGTVVYSCKTGSTWWTELQREAGTGSEWAWKTLQAGGRLTIIVDRPCAESREKRRELAKRYAVAIKWPSVWSASHVHAFELAVKQRLIGDVIEVHTYGGNRDFDAHVVYSSLQYRF